MNGLDGLDGILLKTHGNWGSYIVGFTVSMDGVRTKPLSFLCCAFLSSPCFHR
jgi:hypothetical protein